MALFLILLTSKWKRCGCRVNSIYLFFTFGLHPGKQIHSLRRNFHTVNQLPLLEKCCLIIYPISFFFTFNKYALSKENPLPLPSSLSSSFSDSFLIFSRTHHVFLQFILKFVKNMTLGTHHRIQSSIQELLQYLDITVKWWSLDIYFKTLEVW